MRPSIALILGVIILFYSCKSSSENRKLSIATSANMQYAVRELAREFTDANGMETEVIIGSSGNLTAQIASGAPFNIFLSADMYYPEYLFERGHGYQKPETYAYGQLVLWTCKKDISPSLAILQQDSITHIALANPELAPYGRAAREVLVKEGLISGVSTKLVYGESITQANQFIRTGAAEIGFTALSVVLSSHLQVTGQWLLIPQSAYTPIEQGVLILNNGEKPPKSAIKFYNFLKSEKGQRILEKYGYLPADE